MPREVVRAVASVLVLAGVLVLAAVPVLAAGCGSFEADPIVAPTDAGGATDGSPSTADAQAATDAAGGADARAARGPSRVTVAGGYRVDATEVTQGQYLGFIEATGAGVVAGLPATCAFKSSHIPNGAWPPSTEPAELALPVTRVDWCDALAFCTWAGGRLCGAKSGGSVPTTERVNRDVDQWFSACTHGGDRAFPYGASFDGTACNGLAAAKGAPVGVGTSARCEGGYPGIFDMSGNVYEWEDSCVGNAGAADTCAVRGGSFASADGELACASAQDDRRDARVNGVGFRCCLP